ncbi:MAG: hypothetical protein IKM31_05235 [Oscillospiraceae bacterium]|nr:hypothetical protein [Oscillospiraceae bacterium]
MAALTVSGVLAGCGGEPESGAGGIDVAVITKYTLEEENPLPAALEENLPDLPCAVTTIATGDAESDPTVAMAGMMRLTALIASGDVDVVVASMEEAERQAKAESFTPLSDMFTDEELAGFETISFEVISEDGTIGPLNGVPCGILLKNDRISSMDESGMGVFLICNTEEPEQAADVMMALAELYSE